MDKNTDGIYFYILYLKTIKKDFAITQKKKFQKRKGKNNIKLKTCQEK